MDNLLRHLSYSVSISSKYSETPDEMMSPKKKKLHPRTRGDLDGDDSLRSAWQNR